MMAGVNLKSPSDEPPKVEADPIRSERGWSGDETAMETPTPLRADLRERFLRGSLWNFVGAVLTRTLKLPSSVIVSRLLGPDGYGELGIINSTTGMFGDMAGLRLGLTSTKFVAEFRRKDPAKAGRIMALVSLAAMFSGALCVLLVEGLAPWLAEKTLARPQLSGLLRLSAGFLFFGALNGAQTGTLAGFEAFKTLAKTHAISGAVSFILIVGGVWWGGLRGVILGMVAALAFQCSINHLAARFEATRDGVPFTMSGCLREYHTLWQFSLPATLSGMIVAPTNWLANSMLVNTTDGYGHLGIFNATSQWRTAITFLPAITGEVLTPILAAHFHESRPRLMALNLLADWIMVISCAIPIIVFPEAIRFLYGAKFNSSEFSHALILIALFACVSAFRNGMTRMLQAKNLVWWGCLNNFIWACIFLPMVVFLRWYGSAGLAAAYAMSYLTTTVLFVPFYTARGVVPSRLLLAPELLLVWLGLGLLVAAALGIHSIPHRGAAAIPCAGLIGFGFYALWRGHLRKVVETPQAKASNLKRGSAME